MDMSVLGAVSEALHIVLDPVRLLVLGAGVLAGLFLGIVPGIGGLSGMALLLPFTFTMDSYTAFAFLLGMSAVTGTSDTIPAVLFGVPGTSGAQATIMDGNPMAKRGEAGRALSAAYTASLIGGLMGALLLAVLLPVLRPIVLLIASPELLALTILGIAMVAVLSGSAPLRGLIAAGLGLMVAMIGGDPQTGTLRWTMGQLYLWDGLPIVPVMLGLFAIPALADLAINRQAIASESKYDTRSGMLTGFKDALKNWWLVLRCGGIGAGIGAIPGLSSSVVDWIAYGHAIQTEKGAKETFGKGDVRGVIAPESANNSITGGLLVPTVAFGIPGSASMAILLSVFLMHGLVPGPEMLSSHLDVTYSMVWSIAIANILGAGICFMFSGQLAKLAQLRYTLILPAVITVVFVGSFQATRDWGDLYTLLIFTVLGWTMKQLKWPRPPLVLGFVLGEILERYMFISFGRYGGDWLTRPIVMIVLLLSFIVMAGPLLQHWKRIGGVSGVRRSMGSLRFHPKHLMYVFVFCLVGTMVLMALGYPMAAKIAPLAVGIFVMVLCVLGLVGQLFLVGATKQATGNGEGGATDIHMDDSSDFGVLSTRTVLSRAAIFFGYLLVFMVSVALIGFLPTVPLFIALYMRVEGRENWKHILGQVVLITVAVYVVFDRLLNLPWPTTFIGQIFPALTIIPSV